MIFVIFESRSEKTFLSNFYSPYRIVDDCGGAFAMGAIGGGIFSFMKGWRNSPKVRLLLVYFWRVFQNSIQQRVIQAYVIKLTAHGS